MAETLAAESHDAAHARIMSAISDRERMRQWIEASAHPAYWSRERGSSSLLLLAAALPIILGVVYVVSALAGAVSGVTAGVQ